MNPQKEVIQAKVDGVRGSLQDLAADLRVVDAEVESLSGRRTEHELLQQACVSLEKLGELGAGELFWGNRLDAKGVNERLREVRGRVDAFQTQIDELDGRRQAIVDQISSEEEVLACLDDDLDEIREEEERKKLEWIVEREISAVTPRAQLMAWTRGGEEDRRFRKTLAVSILAGVALGVLLPLIPLPLPKRFVPEQMPKRLAQLVRQELAKPVPPPPMVAETKPEEPEPKPDETPIPPEETDPVAPDTPVVAEAVPVSPDPGPIGPGNAPVTRKAVAKAGILAFKDEFASLAKDDVTPRLGASARLGDADDVSRDTKRSMLTTNAPGSSGGIDLGALSRGGVGGGGGTGEGGGIRGVPLGRATSSIAMIGGGGGGGDRPRARGGAAASRTDEEIQIVFDRYKAAFYRMYNRELRNDPTLRGQMVLRLTIEPDGSVSMCELQSSDMNAPQLSVQVVDRVRTINFGAKDGVAAMTIVYPIDFLPAA
jgi:hypothetical protein